MTALTLSLEAAGSDETDPAPAWEDLPPVQLVPDGQEVFWAHDLHNPTAAARLATVKTLAELVALSDGELKFDKHLGDEEISAVHSFKEQRRLHDSQQIGRAILSQP